LAATAKGLCYVAPASNGWEELHRWAEKKVPGCQLIHDETAMQPYATQLIEYLQGSRRRFTVPFDLFGTPFQMAVWNELYEIPYGETKTYSEMAHLLERPKAVRAVGAAIGANPLLIAV